MFHSSKSVMAVAAAMIVIFLIGGVVLAIVIFRDDGFSEVRAAVTDVLKDPASAKFRNIKRSEKNRDVVCGYVNARNGYNGYSGFHSFIYAADKHVFIISRFGDPGEQLRALEYYKSETCPFPYLD
jgi:hypothetical protein